MSNDQAKNLRALVRSKEKCRTILFASGRDRVGKTMVTTNLAELLSKNDYKTLILDSGAGFFRSDVLLNTMPKYGIKSVMSQGEPIGDVIVSIADNLDVLYIRTVFEAIKTSKDMLVNLKHYLEKLRSTYDFILVDLEELDINSLKDIIDENTRISLILSSESLNCLKPTYSLIKDIEINTDIRDIDIIINKVENRAFANEVNERLKIACDKFLGVKVCNLGYISSDVKIPASFKEQSPITLLYEDCDTSNEFRELFSNIILN